MSKQSVIWIYRKFWLNRGFGLVVWFILRVDEVGGSIPPSPLFLITHTKLSQHKLLTGCALVPMFQFFLFSYRRSVVVAFSFFVVAFFSSVPCVRSYVPVSAARARSSSRTLREKTCFFLSCFCWLTDSPPTVFPRASRITCSQSIELVWATASASPHGYVRASAPWPSRRALPSSWLFFFLLFSSFFDTTSTDTSFGATSARTSFDTTPF